MEVPKRRTRFFGACILFFMVVLAVGTAIVFAAEPRSGSYSLVIEKKFAADTPADVLAEAEKQSYTFKIEGTKRGDNDQLIPINETITLPREGVSGEDAWKSDEIAFGSPFNVSVTEITNDVTLKVNGKEYNMGSSQAETATLFSESPQVRDLNNNGKIVLSRPNKKLVSDGNGGFKTVDVTTTSTFRIKSEWPWGPDEFAKPDSWQPYAKEVELVPGASPIELTGLQAGRYTIEDLSVSGYNLTLGGRHIDVDAGNSGTFYINNFPGSLTITAGGTKGDGGKHYYTIKRGDAPDDAQETEAVASGEKYTLEKLPQGQYTVTEHTFSGAPTEFTVTVPQTDEREKTGKSSALTSGTANSWKYQSLNYKDFDVDYIKMVSFGPLYDSAGNRLSSTNKYTTFRYGLYADDGKLYTKDVISYTKSAGFSGYTVYSMNDAEKLEVPSSKKIGFTVTGLKSSTARTIGVNWIEYDEKEVPNTFQYADTNNSVTIDDRGWIKIKAPEIPDSEHAAKVTYTYTLRKSAGADPIVLTLKPGEEHTLTGLAAGSYLVRETVAIDDEPVGFEMDISGGPFGSTEAGKSSDITVMGDRTLTITKYGSTTENGGRDYTFKIEQTKGENSFETKTVTLKAGGSNSSIILPAGEYKVTPVDDMTEIFELKCSDSSQVKAEVPSSQAATVTFTNVFVEGTMGYRYVHEYYIGHPNENGECTSYTYEGCSPVTTVGGRRDDKEFYGSIDITKEPGFTIGGQTYT